MGNKVRCKFCKFESEKKCAKKRNATISLNKKRICQFYQGDEQKIVEFFERRERPEVTYRPDWLWNRSKRKEEHQKLIKKEMEQYQTTAIKDNKHPVTGDLSRFTGSIVRDKGE